MGRTTLVERYAADIAGLARGQQPTSPAIKGVTFTPAAAVDNDDRMLDPVRTVMAGLQGSAP